MRHGEDVVVCCFFFSSRRRHTRCLSDWSSDVCSSDLYGGGWPTAGRAFRAVCLLPAAGRRRVHDVPGHGTVQASTRRLDYRGHWQPEGTNGAGFLASAAVPGDSPVAPRQRGEPLPCECVERRTHAIKALCTEAKGKYGWATFGSDRARRAKCPSKAAEPYLVLSGGPRCRFDRHYRSFGLYPPGRPRPLVAPEEWRGDLEHAQNPRGRPVFVYRAGTSMDSP